MDEERLVNSIKIKCYPNSYFNWYEKVSKWLGRVTNRYEIIIRNEPVRIMIYSKVGENPANEDMRRRITGVCDFINDTSLGNVNKSDEPFLTSRKVIEVVELFNRLHLINNISYRTTYNNIEFKLFSDGVSKTFQGSDPFSVYELSMSQSDACQYVYYSYRYIFRVGERHNIIELNIYQYRAIQTLIRAAILCNIEERGYFGHVSFYNIPDLIEKSKKYGIIKIVPDSYHYSGQDEYRRQCLEESK